MVIFQIDEERERRETAELLAAEPHVFTRRPSVNHIRRASVREDFAPVAIEQ